MIKKETQIRSGFSMIEIMLASALFIMFSLGVVMVLLQGLSLNRIAEEEMIATQYATEGIEAARSIRNQSFSDVMNTSGTGVTRSEGAWAFSGQDNVFDGKYRRVISVSTANRNGSDIVESGGSADSDTKKVTVTVTWEGPSQENSVVLTTYLTKWE